MPSPMLALTQLSGDLLRTLREHLRPLIAYHLFFTLLASSLVLPGVAWSLAYLLGRFGTPIITNAEMLDILMTPGGILWLLAAVGVTFLVLFLQQAGMILVAVRPRDNHYRLAFEALWASLRRLPSLATLAGLQVGAHLVLPLLVIGISLSATLYFRWLLALPVLMLEDLRPLSALRRSHHLTQRRHLPVALAVIALLVVIIALPIMATTLFDRLFTPLLWWLPERNAVLVPAMLAYLTTYVLLTLAMTFIGIAANALLAACLYLRIAHRELRPAPPPADAHPGRLAWGVEISVIGFALFQAWLIVNSFELRDEVTVIAHRGSSLVAPENTLAAVERAIQDRADMIEIDVRITADDQVMLYHDRRLTRLTGDTRNLGELTREELDVFDVGSWFGDAYVGEPIPGLDEALIAVRGRSRLMIEMKPDPGREVALLAQLILPGTLDRRSFDALGLRHNRITDNEIRLASLYDYEIYAWTINDRTRMSQLIDLGVDAIITDRPERLAELIDIRRELSDGSLLLVKMRNWLRN
ncbi:glycerophosphodiester phosphodiesterase family protein [Halomonas sp.]|uniref:glycerophosphodiester phosphodiesterase family protein n=1 Tax=Halomonas sp. TaxID=1486246 RepID=UPI00356A6A04